MKNNKQILLMLALVFIEVIITIPLILLETKIPAILILTFLVAYTLVVDLILISNNKKEKNKKSNKEPSEFQNKLIKNTIQLDNKLRQLEKRQDQIKKISEEAQKTIKKNEQVKKQLKNLKNQKKFVASVLSNKFHKKNCKFTKLISPKNKIYFNTRSQALRKGFEPCNYLERKL